MLAAREQRARSLSLFVCHQAQSYVDLLEAVEETCGELESLRVQATEGVAIAYHLKELVESWPKERPIDSDIEIVNRLERAERLLEEAHEDLRQRQQSAVRDPDLRGQHEWRVIDQYQRAIAIVGSFHSVIRDSRWIVLEHDADLDGEDGKAFESVDDLLADLCR